MSLLRRRLAATLSHCRLATPSIARQRLSRMMTGSAPTAADPLAGIDAVTLQQLQRAATAIQQADALLITVGAGMGVDSGLPDFRGNEGFWKAYPPMAELNMSFADAANPENFVSNPHFAFGFYLHRLNLYRKTKPHYGFQLLHQWGQQRSQGYFVFTSNVDGHFAAAGLDPERIVEVHGSIHHFQCLQPCWNDVYSADDINADVVDPTTFLAADPLPTCPRKCGYFSRPNILMFNDSTWLAQRTRQQQRLYQQWLNSVKGKKLVVVECGAGTAIPTVRAMGESMLNSNTQNVLIRVNPRESFLHASNRLTRYVEPQQQEKQFVGLAMGSLQALNAIDHLMKQQPQSTSR